MAAFQPPASEASTVLLSYTPRGSDCLLEMTYHWTWSYTQSETLCLVTSLFECIWMCWVCGSVNDGCYQMVIFIHCIIKCIPPSSPLLCEVDYTGMRCLLSSHPASEGLLLFNLFFFIVLQIGSINLQKSGLFISTDRKTNTRNNIGSLMVNITTGLCPNFSWWCLSLSPWPSAT